MDVFFFNRLSMGNKKLGKYITGINKIDYWYINWRANLDTRPTKQDLMEEKIIRGKVVYLAS